MMTKQTLIVTFAALALAGGCKKKDPDAGKGPGTGSAAGSVTAPGTGGTPGSAKDPGPGSAPVAPLAGEALAKAYLATWAAWNAGDKATFAAAYAADAVSHWPDSAMPERKGGVAIADEAFNFRGGFPDAKSSAQLVLVNGRTVAAVHLTVGTNSGPMKTPMGELPATNKKLGMLLFHAVTYNDANQVVDEWFIMDGNTMASQLGMSPQPGRPVMDKGADAPTIVIATGGDAEKANLVAAQKGNDDFNKHDFDALMAGWTADAVESDQASPADTVGTAAIATNLKAFLGAFSDGKIAAITSWAAGDYVMMVSTFSGTNDGDMGPMKKTGKSVTMTLAEISKLEAGKVKQLWRFYDGAAMATQLGMMEPPPAAGAAAPAKTD